MNNKLYIPAIILLAFIPAIVGSILVFGISGKFITDFHLVTSDATLSVDPRQFSDENYYWHQIDTYNSVGFDGGYYAITEEAPRISQFRFSAWGPFIIIFYGTIMNLIGFSTLNFVLINITLFALSVILLGYVVKLNLSQLAMLAVLFIVYPNIILYVPSFLMEMLNLIIAVNLSVVFYKLLQDDEPLSPIFIILALILLIAAGLFRVSWVIVYLPAFAIIGWRIKSWAGLAVGVLLSAVLGIAIYILFNITAAPYESLVVLSGDISSILTAIQDRVLYNLRYILFGLTFWVLLRFAAVIVVVGVAYQAIMRVMNKNELYNWREISFHLINIVGILLANLTIYWFIEGRGFRVIGPHLLTSLILLIMFKRYRLIFPILMIFVLGMPNLLQTHTIWVNAHYSEQTFDFENFENELLQAGIVYSESDNGWCNTLLFTNELKWYPEYLRGIRYGIAFSQLVSFEEYDVPPQSQYVFLDPDTILLIPDTWQLDLLLEVPVGSIYRNLDANCP